MEFMISAENVPIILGQLINQTVTDKACASDDKIFKT